MAKKKAKKAKTKNTRDPRLPVFQLKITLEDIEPPVWRRVQVHDCTLDELHEIIQTCMDWDDEHMHAFEIDGRQYSSVEDGGFSEFHDSRRIRLSRLVDKGCYAFEYEYDFGDSWRHAIEIEETRPAEENRHYPVCVDGARACPPEDCGGPWGYPDLLTAVEDPGDKRHEETLEWIGDDFDPEKFDLVEINEKLQRVRRWLGNTRGKHMPAAKFTEEDEIRVKPGVAHEEYPDIPLGGWVGTVMRIVWLVPITYEIEWSEETLAAVHPVYFKRCRRDDAEPDEHWLDEGQIELNLGQPPAPEQPADIVTRPLALDRQDDRIRSAFGLTSDDPLPPADEQSFQQYLEYLRARVSFPFKADRVWEMQEDLPENEEEWDEDEQGEDETDQEAEEQEEEKEEKKEEKEKEREVTVLGFAAPADLSQGIVCEIRRAEETLQVPLLSLMLDEEDPNCQYVDDYREWLWEARDRAEMDGEDFDEADNDDYDFTHDEDEEYDEEYEEDEWDEDEDWEEDDDDWSDPYEPRAEADQFAEKEDIERLHPIRREQPPVGRNDPCPCGSGKKYKKCCLNKQKVSAKFPIGTVALYGPDDKRTTKIVAGVIKEEGAEAIIERWVGTGVKDDPKVQQGIEDFFKQHGVQSVVATDRNMGCPHEEGEDFPVGGDCPFCPYWEGKQGSGAWR